MNEKLKELYYKDDDVIIGSKQNFINIAKKSLNASLSLSAIAQQIADLAARTRDNKLKPDELSGGTFTLTNTGSRGALFDTPVVFLPQSAILGTGVVTKRPVVVTDENGQDSIAIRSMVYLALSYDHRLIDGADASRFLVAVKTRLEEANFESNFGY